MKQRLTYGILVCAYIATLLFKHTEASAFSNGLTTWDNIFGKPNDLVRMVDTPSIIATKSNINTTAQVIKDSALSIRSALKNYTNGSGLGIFGSGGNFTFYIDSTRIMTTSSATATINSMNNDINGKVPNSRTITINGVTQDLSANRTWTVGGAADYYNSATTTSGTATFYLTNNKLSSGTALYSQINYVNPLVNNVNGNYTFGWTVSPDLKTLTVQSRVATNTAVIALIGISVLGSTVQVPNGTTIQVLVKGQ